MDKLTDLSFEEADRVEQIAVSLHSRIQEETEVLLKEQLAALGVGVSDMDRLDKHCEKVLFQDDPFALAVYTYKGIKILGVKVSENRMAIEFDIPKLESQTKGEDQ